MSRQQLEQELLRAREMGRWLSDDEREALDRDQHLMRLEQERESQRRLRLVAFSAVCLLVPPLWPIAVGLSLHLLFPQTFRRLVLIAGGSLLLLGLISVGLSVTLVTVLWMLIS